MSNRLVEWGYAAGWRVVRAMPESAARRLFRAGADRAARKNGAGTQRLARNLRRVVGPDVTPDEMDRLVRDGLRSYSRYWMEAFRLPSMSMARIRSFRLEREHLLVDAYKAGTGCIIALPHAGNWDAAGAHVARGLGLPLTAVAERLRPEGLYRRFLAYRESLGMNIVPLTGGGRPIMDVLEERLGQAHVVPLLADRDLSARGIEVEFFGGRTRMPAGPALLALRTGAPLFVVSLWFEPDTGCGYVAGPLEVPGPEAGPLDVRVKMLTQTVADHLAEGIAKHPADWHMLQKLWLDESALDAPASAKPAQESA